MASPYSLPYPNNQAAAWLPMHKMRVEEERSGSSVCPNEIHNINQVHPEDRLGAWQQALRSTFVDLMPEVPTKNEFNGMIETVDCPGMRVSRITAEAHRVHRSHREIERSNSTNVFLNVHLAGVGRVLHSAGSATLAVGDCILVDPAQPYVLEFDTAFTQLCIQLPEWRLREQLDSPLEMFWGRGFSMTSATGKVLMAALEMNLLEAGSDIADGSSADLFMQVMNFNLNDVMKVPVNPVMQRVSRTNLETRLRQYVSQNFRSDEISAADAANKLCCSVRNIHKICQRSGTTFGKLLLDARLSAAAHDLAFAKDPHIRVSDIAYDSGFNDISHFCKAFRIRFAMSPTEFRKQRL